MLNLNCFTIWFGFYYTIHVLVICSFHCVQGATFYFYYFFFYTSHHYNLCFLPQFYLFIFFEFLPFFWVLFLGWWTTDSRWLAATPRIGKICHYIQGWGSMFLAIFVSSMLCVHIFLRIFRFWFLVHNIFLYTVSYYRFVGHQISHVFITLLLDSGMVLWLCSSSFGTW